MIRYNLSRFSMSSRRALQPESASGHCRSNHFPRFTYGYIDLTAVWEGLLGLSPAFRYDAQTIRRFHKVKYSFILIIAQYLQRSVSYDLACIFSRCFALLLKLCRDLATWKKVIRLSLLIFSLLFIRLAGVQTDYKKHKDRRWHQTNRRRTASLLSSTLPLPG